jgi:predicted transcriptional regulator of viral defense system
VNSMDKIEKMVQSSPNGIITVAQLTKAGLHRGYLHNFVESGELYRFGRGLYVQSSAWEDDFYLLQQKYSRGIYSHDTALYLLGYSDRTPAKYTMTFPKGYNALSLKQETLIVKRAIPENYDFGIIEINRHPATRFVFTIWSGRCATSCVAAGAIFKLWVQL